MNKSLVALIVALIAAATMFSSAAEAGLRIRLGFGGPLPGFTAHGNGGTRLQPLSSQALRRAAQ